MTRVLLLAALALACVASPTLAAEVATVGDTAVILPYGQWITAVAQTATEILIPVIVAALGIAARKLPWLASMWFTEARIDRMVRLAADYALNAVKDAATDKSLSVDVGYTVLKVGLERAIGSSPRWLIDAAGGEKGIAVAVGLVLVAPTNTFGNESFRVIASVISEWKAGALCLFFGSVRLLALRINGRRGRETSLIRTLGCLGGLVFWLAIALGFLLTAPPITTGVAVYTILALAELHASGRAASDMAAEDTFGFRACRRQNGGGSSRSSSAA